MKLTTEDVSSALKKNYPYILTILAVVLLVNRNLLMNPFDPPTGIDMLGWIAATSYLSNTNNFIYAWLNYSFGVSGALSQLYNILTVVNLLTQNSVLTVKIYILIAFLIAGISMYILTYFFTLNRLSGLISALVFILNPLFIGLVGSGQLNTVMVYSLGPILFLSFSHAIEKRNINSIILFSFITLLMLVARLDQFLYYGLFVGLYCIFTIFISKDIKKMTSNISQVLLLSILFVAMLGMISFLPIIMGANPPYFAVRTLLIQRLEWYSSNIYETLLGVPSKSFIPVISQIHFPQDPPHYNINYLLIPTIFSYSALLFKRNKLTLFLILSALLSVLLATGSRPPFGNGYSWMWLNLPYFEIFSIPSRWLIITHFSYSVLIGITINEISKKFQTGSLNKNLTKLLIVVLIGSIFLGNWFAVGNGLQIWKFPKSEVEAYNFISNQSDDFRVLPVPFAREVMETKFGLLRDLGFESSLFHGKEVVRTGEGVRYSKEFIDYLDGLMLTNKTNNLPKILGGFNAKYIILSERLATWNTRGVNPEYQHAFFKNQKGLKTVYTYWNATVYENEYWTPHIFAPSKSAIVVGGRETLTALAEVDEFDFSDWALFFTDQVIRENGKETYVNLLNKSDALIFVNSEPLDLAMLMLDNATRIRVAEYAYPSINAKEHWVGSDFAIKTGMFVLNSRTLSTSEENNVSIPVRLEKDGSYEVWARVVCDKNSGKLSLSIDGREVGSIIPYSPSLTIKWIKLGDVDLSNGRHNLLLQNKKSPYGTANDLDEIILVEPEELKAKVKETKELIEKSKRVVVIVEKNKLYNFLYKELEGEEVIIDDDQAKFWQNVNPAHVVLSDDSGIKARSENSLRIDIHEAGRKYYTLIEKRYDPFQDWSDKDYFVLWFKGQETNTSFLFNVLFNGSHNDRVGFSIPDVFTGWKKMVFLKSYPDVRKGEINWSQVWLIRLASNDKNITGDFYLDRISSGRFEEMEMDVIGKLDFPKREYQTSEFKDYLVFYSQKEDEEGIKFPEFFDIKRPSPEVNFTKINPTKYEVKVNAKEPFFLIFSDSYHPLWKAYINGEEIDSVISYSFINGFYINKTGEMDIKVEFIGQRYVWIGGIISVTSFVFAIVYILFGRRIKHKLGKKEED